MIAKRDIILYHATPSKNLGSILRRGLRPRRRPDAPVDFPVIYLAGSPKAAAAWAIDFVEDIQDTAFEEPMATLAVRVRAGSEVWFDPESYGEGFYVTKPIPPSDIRAVRREWSGKFPAEEKEQYEKRYERLRGALEGFQEEGGEL